jgi:predicted ABC-type transport system involved in lysophospholipase L1 biosynthesis ATPase subunit
MKIPWPLVAGWYHAVLLTALPWIAWQRPWWAPAVAAGALAAHLPVFRSRSAEPWAGAAVALSASAFLAARGGWEISCGWLLLGVLVAAVARVRPRRDASRPDAADYLAVGGWGCVFVLAPRLVAFDFGGWLAPAVLLYAAQRLARTGVTEAAAVAPGAPVREVRGTLSLNAVVVAGPDNLPRSVPLELELRAGDSLSILCDAADEAAILADVLAGRREPFSGNLTVDGSPLRVGERLVALVAPGEPFVSGGLSGNLAALGDRPLDRAASAAVREACSLTEVAEALGDRPLATDGEPLSVFHKMLVLVARVIPSSDRLLVVVDPMPWVNAMRGELWRTAVVRASVGRTSIWITPDRDLAGRATLVMEYRQGALRRVAGEPP